MRDVTPKETASRPYPSDQKRGTAIDRFPNPSARFFGDVQGASKAAEKSKLDDTKVADLHRTMLGHYLRELDAQSRARREMERDESYYDGDQWDPKDIALLTSRGQDPLVFNIIATSINWILGTERRGRTDFKIIPRTKRGSKSAGRKTELMKYISDVNMSEFHISQAFEEAVKAGVGWLEAGIQDEDEGEPIYERSESWRNILYDSVAGDLDLNDGRFMFRTKWIDSDVAVAMFPDRETTIRLATQAVDGYGAVLDRMGDEPMDSREDAYDTAGSTTNIEHPSAPRDRIRMIEAWFKLPVMEDRVSGGEFSGELFDPASPGHVEDVLQGRARKTHKLTFRMYCMIMTTNGVLHLSPSPYRHNKYPFTPVWGYRKKKDGTPYGIVRAMRDAQRDINKRFSKALFILNSRKVIMDEGAVDDLDQFEEEISRPDPIIVKKAGKQLEIDVDRELASSHIDIMNLSRGMIQQLSGVADANLGQASGGIKSGKAITALQDQGSLSTAPIFDNLRMARQFHGAKKLSLVEQFITEEKAFRITNKRGNPDYVVANDGLPENDIVRTKADFLINETDWNATIRQAQTQELGAVLQQIAPVNPAVAMAMLDLWIETMDLPNADELVKRVRGITGMEDPDADPNAPDPEREAKMAAQAEAQAMEKRAAEANVAGMEAKAAQTMAAADKTAADAEKVRASIPSERLTQGKSALDLAIAMLTAEPAVDTADALMVAAGAQEDPMAAMLAEQEAAAMPPPQAVPPQQQPPMPPEGMGIPMEGMA